MARRKPRPELFDGERKAIADEATRLHELLMACSSQIRYGSPDAISIAELSGAIIVAIRRITGADPKWMQMRPGSSYPRDSD